MTVLLQVKHIKE